MSVGILCHPVLNKTASLVELPAPSVRMALLFYEFLGRYKEWKNAKLQETIAIIVIFLLGLGSLLIPWFLPGIRIIIIIAMIVLFYFATRYYLLVSERVNHLYVNVHILHHHLIGKLEVGFCDHTEQCHCVENFCCYVLKNYNISLYKGTLR
ncbi:hypothetical protein [Desulfosporosinus sp. BG]|uniref:hypothetical protein n=1 Tax=Desulfosporosinus sp. BG TaxID=1633135 RepID=UPI000B0C52C0|nr:hypothetical protein [Desulfosporosinus sp. BG]